MEIDEIVSRTRKTAKLLGYFISGMVILFFFLVMAGEFEGTWFDTTDNQNNEQIEQNEQIEAQNGN
jgi:hypothetical protein